jgi:hypothetical protein
MSLVTTIVILGNRGLAKEAASQKFQLHQLLGDDADWNAPTWTFQDELIPDYCTNLLNLFNSTAEGFSFQAVWVGENPKTTQQVTIDELIFLLKNNKLGTKTKYVVRKIA